ncbi:MAG: hypothetical protein CL678_11335 [Bdellovibrionaceae bacterium]|nr:hypothetical protein [Pseudobdellovibrionaceae bacterium]
MFSKTLGILSLCGSVILSGCGVLGEKDDSLAKRIIENATTDCLGEFSQRFENYTKGTVDLEKWKETIECTTQSLRLFNRFVGKSSPQGFTVSDIRFFAENFLIKDKKITDGLISGVFQVKASVLGGDESHFGEQEIDRIIKILEAALPETIKLYPHIVELNKSKTLDDYDDKLILFRNALVSFTQSVSTTLKEQINGDTERPMKLEEAQQFVDELERLFDFELSADTVTFIGILKTFLVGGSSKEISGKQWALLIETGGSLGGDFLAYDHANPFNLWSGNKYLSFILKLFEHAKTVLIQSMQWHGGLYPFELIDEVVDSVPGSWISLGRDAIKEVSRPIIRKFLKAGPNEKGLNSYALDELYRLASLYIRGAVHLEKIFFAAGVEPEPESSLSPKDFIEAAVGYKSELRNAERDQISRLIYIAENFRPLYMGQDEKMNFSPLSRITLNHMNKMHLYRLLGEEALKIYSLSETKSSLSFQNVCSLTHDLKPILEELAFLDPTRPNQEYSRFKEADLFTFASNGDESLNLDEINLYVGALLSIERHATEIEESVLTDYGCETEYVDEEKYPGLTGIKALCFRHHFYGNWVNFTTHMPGMSAFYDQLSEEERRTVQYRLEIIARGEGHENQIYTKFDIERYTAIMLYLESLMVRFDEDLNQKMDLDEAYVAYPVFRKVFQDASPFLKGRENLTFGAFTYTLAKGRPPLGSEQIKLLGWMTRKPSWKKLVKAGRREFFSIFKEIAKFLFPDPNSEQAKKCEPITEPAP